MSNKKEEQETSEHFVTVIGTMMNDAWDDDNHQKIKEQRYQDAISYAKSWQAQAQNNLISDIENRIKEEIRQTKESDINEQFKSGELMGYDLIKMFLSKLKAKEGNE